MYFSVNNTFHKLGINKQRHEYFQLTFKFSSKNLVMHLSLVPTNFSRFSITLPTLLSACYFQFFNTFYLLLHPIFNFCHPSRYIFAIISPCPGPKCGECIHYINCSVPVCLTLPLDCPQNIPSLSLHYPVLSSLYPVLSQD